MNSYLKGQLVQQIAYSINTISILFESGDYVTTSGFFELSNQNKTAICNELFPVSSDWGFLELLEKKIVSIDSNKIEKSLIIHFEDEIKLVLFENENYESYDLYINNKRIVR